MKEAEQNLSTRTPGEPVPHECHNGRQDRERLDAKHEQRHIVMFRNVLARVMEQAGDDSIDDASWARAIGFLKGPSKSFIT